MASYDSDSSGAEDDDYTETNVLLGYASKEPTDDTTSQLGGHPTWLDPNTPPPGSLAKCKVCNNLLTLLLQLNGDLPERFPGHERRLYLFGCRRKTCRRKEGSIRGFRATRASDVTQAQPQQHQQQKQPAQEASAAPAAAPPPQAHSNLGESLFGVKKPQSATSAPTNPFSTGASSSAPSNPFSSPSASAGPSNPFASASSLAAKPAQKPQQPQPAASLSESFASKARISSPPPEEPSSPAVAMGPVEPWPEQSQFPSPYPHYHLDADYEVIDNTPDNTIPSQARLTDMDIDAVEGGSSSAGTTTADDNKAAFESSMDTAFQKFADRMAQNPEQVLRYEFRGQPLLYSKTDAVGKKLAPQQDGGKVQAQKTGAMPKCGNCGAERVFELQLTPHAITELEAEELGLEGMEWGTVMLGVCAKDCVARGAKAGEVGYVEEWCGVQWEEQVPRK